jgi:hypothetical protein
MRFTVIGDKEKIRPALESFAALCEIELNQSMDKWQGRANKVTGVFGSKIDLPPVTFAVLDLGKDNELQLFNNYPTPIMHKVVKVPLRKMESFLKRYLDDKKIKAEVKYAGD